MTVEFENVDAKEIEVTVNGDNYGMLKLDDQGTWVLWPAAIDDAVSYFEDLEETKETITDEINDYTEVA